MDFMAKNFSALNYSQGLSSEENPIPIRPFHSHLKGNLGTAGVPSGYGSGHLQDMRFGAHQLSSLGLHDFVLSQGENTCAKVKLPR